MLKFIKKVDPMWWPVLVFLGVLFIGVVYFYVHYIF
jgi:hypothetical protein